MSAVRIGSLSDEELEALRNVAKALSYFVRNRVYSYIDRLANAFSISSVRQVLSEALRDLKSEKDRGENVWLPRPSDIETVLRLSEADLSVLKVLASMAITHGW